jgi:hypothetical protein
VRGVRNFPPSQRRILVCVGVAGRYSNRPDLLERLRNVAAILSDGGQDDGVGSKVPIECLIRSRRLHDRFSSEDLQAMIDLYRSGITAREVAEKFGVSLRSVKRLLHRHGVRREGRVYARKAHHALSVC